MIIIYHYVWICHLDTRVFGLWRWSVNATRDRPTWRRSAGIWCRAWVKTFWSLSLTCHVTAAFVFRECFGLTFLSLSLPPSGGSLCLFGSGQPCFGLVQGMLVASCFRLSFMKRFANSLASCHKFNIKIIRFVSVWSPRAVEITKDWRWLRVWPVPPHTLSEVAEARWCHGRLAILKCHRVTFTECVHTHLSEVNLSVLTHRYTKKDKHNRTERY